VTTLVILPERLSASPVFVFYSRRCWGLSVAFPAVLTAMYTAAVLLVYGIVCLSTADSAEYPVGASRGCS